MKAKFFILGSLFGVVISVSFFNCGVLKTGGNVISSGIGLGQDIFGSGSSGSGGNDDQRQAAMGCSGGSPLSGSESNVSRSGGSRSRGQGEAVHVSWPSDDDWAGYGLKGLRQPAGSSVANVALFQGTFYVTLVDAGRDAYNGLVAQIKQLTGAGNPFSQIRTENGEMCGYEYGSHYVELVVDFVDMELVIRALR